MTTSAEQLVGTWRLVSWVWIDGDGKRTEQMGPGAHGLLTYTADGFMFGMLAAVGRKPFAGTNAFEGTAEECQHAMSTGLGYCGRYHLEGDTVVHTVELSMFPNWVGAEQRRVLSFDGDRVMLRTPPLVRKGASGVAELVWRRA